MLRPVEVVRDCTLAVCVQSASVAFVIGLLICARIGDQRRRYRSIMRVRADRGSAGCLRVGRQGLIGQRRVPGAQRLIEAPDGGLGFGHAFAG